MFVVVRPICIRESREARGGEEECEEKRDDGIEVGDMDGGRNGEGHGIEVGGPNGQ